MVISCGLALLFSIAAGGAAYRQERIAAVKTDGPRFRRIAVGLFAAALLVRLLMGYYMPGYAPDINLFKNWGRATNEVGFQQIYRQDIFLDYPPGYLYVLTLLEKLRLLLGWELESAAYTLLIKLPAILGDLFCAGVLLVWSEKRMEKSSALFVTAAYLFCPPVLLNSANWGQMDSFVLSFLLVSVLLLYRGKYWQAGAFFGLSIIIKPQMLTFVPVFVLFVLRKKKYRALLPAVLAALGVIALTALPFTQHFDYGWLISQYAETMDGYPYYSVNAYNLFALFGRNWVQLPDSGITPLLATAAGPVLATALCAALMFKSERDDVVFAAPVILMSVAYLFTVKMHERYVFHALIFILLVYVMTREKKLLLAFSLTVLTHFLNVRHVLYELQHGNAYDPNAVSVRLMAAAQLAAFLYLLFVIWQIYRPQGEKIYRLFSLPKDKGETVLPGKPAEKVRLTKADGITAGAIAAAYAVAAFWALGSHVTALTPWTPAQGEAVVIEANNPADTLCFISGLVPDANHHAARLGMNVKIESSLDGVSWSDEGTLAPAGVFEWKRQTLSRYAQYFRFTALDDQTVINEISLRNSLWENPEIIRLKEGNGQALMDEQNKVPSYPTYYDSTYFDEIYHARTAYESILHLEPYENTHPPLGKQLIALGIRIFGMNPFGWRFAGALFGVLMLPLFYYLLKQLFGGVFWPAAGTVLFSLDFMHFTQTRIATIDTYAVFFILAMYSAMVAFCKRDLLRTPLRRSLFPLLLSGALMGIGIAAKWTVAYGALGLAVLLFAKLILTCIRAPKQAKARCRSLAFKICGWCCLFFLVIPFLLYFSAFLPITTLPDHGSVWQSFINYQTGMYDYHAHLKAEHFFSSPWYEWPFIVKPIWFFFTNSLPEQGMVSTISSFGSPAVWWAGIPAMVFLTQQTICRRSRAGFVVLVGFLSAYLPWALVPRISFIYHYFTAVPFLIAAIIFTLRTCLANGKAACPVLGPERLPALTWGKAAVLLYLGAALLLFIRFFPVLSGVPADSTAVKNLQWFSQWYFIS